MGRNSGYSVIEIMIATAISGLVALAAFVVILNGTRNYEASISKIEARKILSTAAEALNRVFTYTYNLQASPVAIPANILVTGNGQLRTGSWTSIAPAPGGAGAGAWYSIASFRRDTGVGAQAAPKYSRFQQTGIFYITPTPTKSGVLFINLGTTVAPMVPSYGNLFFDRITELEIDDVQTVQTDAVFVKSFRITMTVRVFLTGERARWRWCPVADINANFPNCVPFAPYKDYRSEFRIVIPNQEMRLPGGGNNIVAPDRMLGPLYLFPILN